MFADQDFDLADESAMTAIYRRERAHRAALIRAAARRKKDERPAAMPSQMNRQHADSNGKAVAWLPNLTRHGAIRLQQRGITLDQVTAVLAYGTEQRSHGASRYFLDHQARKRISTEMPELLHQLQRTDIQVVTGHDGVLVTAEHRTKRTRRCIQRRWSRGGMH